VGGRVGVEVGGRVGVAEGVSVTVGVMPPGARALTEVGRRLSAAMSETRTMHMKLRLSHFFIGFLLELGWPLAYICEIAGDGRDLLCGDA
jgi:hypothetical protein